MSITSSLLYMTKKGQKTLNVYEECLAYFIENITCRSTLVAKWLQHISHTQMSQV